MYTCVCVCVLLGRGVSSINAADSRNTPEDVDKLVNGGEEKSIGTQDDVSGCR